MYGAHGMYHFLKLSSNMDLKPVSGPKPDFATAVGTTHSGYGTTSVWCRGGRRYVQGCWGFPYLKIEKFVGFTIHVF